jgi:hypothetical protein
MFRLINPESSWELLDELEIYLKTTLADLPCNAYNAMHSIEVAEESQVAWDAYQHIRRELSWHKLGKDWRKDEREWPKMMTVNYDEPMKASKLKGEFEAKILEVK